ncbi:hypothetical protein BDP81DRAFT_447783 [Colletotrichum phormii]|uniref:Rhodopsin domain-containing protein n=1 Tax=Colletotrichum phormii TaxID=359342 RepID=A0AAJ0EG29_9PEZI|nr:uncharacterized protein BDP81DRAFT_447783 [Colletotrichum phormii]KAK1638872.1 hypothetical protein BDP81DRAFT_447783 [Colletotrichum phormii]
MVDDKGPMIIAFCAILSNALVTTSFGWGNGKHFTALDLEQKQNTVKWMIAAYVPGIETLGFPKLAVIAFLTRLLAPGKLHLRILWSMGTICCLSLTAMVLTLLLQYTPPRALWTFSMPRDCLDPKILEGLAFWASSFSAFFDFYLAVYPAVVLWKLQMRFQKKLAVTCALGMGIIIEGNLTIIAACIPILQPILEMFKERSIWSLDRKSGSYQYNSHSKRSAHQQQQQQQDSIELRSKPRKKVDVYGFTMHAKEDSEESIVHPDKHSA